MEKDPDAVLDYGVDWSAELAKHGNDTINTSTWIVPTGITKDSDSHTTTTATIWLSGGSVGKTYKVVNRITTVGGRTDDRTLSIQVVEK